MGTRLKAVDSNPYDLTRYALPGDTLFAEQWHLLNTGQSGGTAGVDLNVTPVWDRYDGSGVSVVVVDDGVDYLHGDLDGNFDTAAPVRDLQGQLHDAFPASADSAHGTAVAGVIAAEANGSGTVGVAYGATLAGIDIFYDSQMDEVTALAALSAFDVSNHSWGYTSRYVANARNDGNAFWVAFFDQLEQSVKEGRNGLGTINLVAAGNDRGYGRDANDSNFTNLPETIAVAAVGHDGFVSYYSTPGASVLIASPSNGPTGSGIWTTDRIGAEGYSNGSNESGNTEADYTAYFGGTSSATPAASGVVALMLEANPDLGWRDVQEILAMTARHTGSALTGGTAGSELYGWEINAAETWNGGGMHFSNDYGFGLIDADAAVRVAESWSRVQKSSNWAKTRADVWTGTAIIPDNSPAGYDFTFRASSNMDVEMVGLTLDLTGAWWGDIAVTLTSPEGTTSVMSRGGAGGQGDADSWLFTSNAFRGEDPSGVWRVHVEDQWTADEALLTRSELHFFGDSDGKNTLHVITDEFDTLVALNLGHGTDIRDTDGGKDEFNAAALTTDTVLDVLNGTGIVDGIAITGLSGIERFVTGSGDDTLTGSRWNNVLSAGAGDDILNGLGGKDTLIGGTGADTLNGGANIDTVAYSGQAQGVYVSLSSGQTKRGASGDVLNGIENLTGSRNNDTLLGDAGANVLDGSGGKDLLDGLGGTDTLIGGNGFDTLNGNLGGDVLRGGRGRDTLDGGNGKDRLAGGLGADTLVGGVGRDTLKGNSGNDRLEGGTGRDILNGGNGNDVFVFSGPGFGDDVIEDFDSARDELELSATLWGGGLTVAQVINRYASDVGRDVILDFGGDTITLRDIEPGDLTGGIDII